MGDAPTPAFLGVFRVITKAKEQFLRKKLFRQRRENVTRGNGIAICSAKCILKKNV